MVCSMRSCCCSSMRTMGVQWPGCTLYEGRYLQHSTAQHIAHSSAAHSTSGHTRDTKPWHEQHSKCCCCRPAAVGWVPWLLWQTEQQLQQALTCLEAQQAPAQAPLTLLQQLQQVLHTEPRKSRTSPVPHSLAAQQHPDSAKPQQLQQALHTGASHLSLSVHLPGCTPAACSTCSGASAHLQAQQQRQKKAQV